MGHFGTQICCVFYDRCVGFVTSFMLHRGQNICYILCFQCDSDVVLFGDLEVLFIEQQTCCILVSIYVAFCSADVLHFGTRICYILSTRCVTFWDSDMLHIEHQMCCIFCSGFPVAFCAGSVTFSVLHVLHFVVLT